MPTHFLLLLAVWLGLWSACLAQAPSAEYLRLRGEGDAKLQAGDKSAALKLFEDALKADARQLGIHDRIARVALELGQKERGLQAIEAMVKMDARLAQDAEIAGLKRKLENLPAPSTVDGNTALAVRTAELALKDVAAAYQRSDQPGVEKFALEARQSLMPVLLGKGADYLPAWAAAGRAALALKDDHLAAAALAAIERLRPDYASQTDLLDLMAELNRRPLQSHLPEARARPQEFLHMATQPRAGAPYVNSLGMKFVPVPGTDVLFSVWETRVGDFKTFVQETGHNADEGMWSLDKDGWNQRGHTWKNPGPGFQQTDAHPVVGVSYEDAVKFCAWLTQRERAAGRLTAAQSYRLPADLEWSKAVGLPPETGSTPKDRDGKIKDVYPWGAAFPPPNTAGNYAGGEWKIGHEPSDWGTIASLNDGYPRTAPVGQFAANRFGLFDLGGNVWEWCEDFFDGRTGFLGVRWENAQARAVVGDILEGMPAKLAGILPGDVILRIGNVSTLTGNDVAAEIRRHAAGTGIEVEFSRNGTTLSKRIVLGESPGARALRGASWDLNYPAYLLSSYRFSGTPDLRGVSFGFRCVMVMGSRP